MTSKTRLKVLFLCTGNSCRSQMAEAWACNLKGNLIEPYSAGTAPKGIDPRAIRAMAEVGVDISEYTSKSVLDLPDIEFDYVITLCDDAQQACPFFPAKTALIHHGFDDPRGWPKARETKMRPCNPIGAYGTKSGLILKPFPNHSVARLAKTVEGTIAWEK